MTIVSINATADALQRQLRADSIIWIGAGASVAAGYPSATQLVATMKLEADDPISSDDFPEVTDQFVASRGPAALQALLQREIGIARLPTPLHQSLARMAKAGRVHTIITTNYDDLVERSLAQEQVNHVLQTFEANFQGAAHGLVRVIKVHGSREDWSRVILSGNSYAEFAAVYRRLQEQLSVLCRQYPLTFVGSSLMEPRVLGWLAALSSEERQRLQPWRAFLTALEWDRLLAYETPQFQARGVLEGQFRPLILADHASLQTLWTTVAEASADARSNEQPGAPAASIADLVRAAVLLQNALDTLGAAYDGGGSSTHLHRRLDLAERWLRELRPVLERMSKEVEQDVANYFGDLATWAANIAPRARRRLPKAGEVAYPDEDPDARSDRRWALYSKNKELGEWLTGRKVLLDVDEAIKWRILGFDDAEGFEDHVYPRLHQLLKGKTAPARELAQHLLNQSAFSPAGLASEGYRSSLVMDVVNALVREQGATWTPGLGETAVAELTSTGRSLLTKLLAK